MCRWLVYGWTRRRFRSLATTGACVVAAVGCRHDRPGRVADGVPQRRPLAWTYDVTADEGTARLSIVASFAGTSADAVVDDDAAAFVEDVEYETSAGWKRAARAGEGWSVPCLPSTCRVRYVFALREAAASIDDAETAFAAGGLVVAPPSTWLLHPAEAPAAGRLSMRVHVPATTGFATAFARDPASGPDAFEADTAAFDELGFSVFGPLRRAVVESGDARVEAAIAASGLSIPENEAFDWVRSAVSGIAAYYGRFPAPRALVVVVPGKQSAMRGETLGGGGPAVLVRAPEDLTAAQAHDDWVMTHELLHVTMPSLGREHAWLSEGIATYVEPIVRARAGIVTPERFWRDLLEGLPQGLPQAGDEGLERTHTWGRTYWGGALFCLLVDLRVRETTRGARSLDDALRAVVATGADVEAHWDIQRFLDVGDAATGTTAFADLYRQIGLAPGTVGLDTIWSRLGVRAASANGASEANVTFDDSAPLAWIRKAITARTSR